MNSFKLQSDVCVTRDDQGVGSRIPARLSVITNGHKSSRSDLESRVCCFLKKKKGAHTRSTIKNLKTKSRTYDCIIYCFHC